MTFVVIDKKNDIVRHQYSDVSEENIDLVKNEIKKEKFLDGITKNGYRKFIVTDNNNFYYQLENIKNSKDGKHQIKVIHNAVQKLLHYFVYNEDIDNKVKEISIHNTRNIHNYILERLKSTFNHNILIQNSHKKDYIKEVIVENPDHVAKDILNTLKSLEQIAFEYDIIDFINYTKELTEKDFTEHKIHTLLVLAFYIYEHDFNSKNIKVNIDNNYDSISVHFSTFRSALSLIFENCLKYSKPNSEIIVDYSYNGGSIYKIDIEMESVYNSDIEIDQLFLPNFRGFNAKKIEPSKGEGLGLYVAKRLFSINGIDIQFKLMERKERNIIDGVEYSKNIFIIDIPKSKIICKI